MGRRAVALTSGGTAGVAILLSASVGQPYGWVVLVVLFGVPIVCIGSRLAWHASGDGGLVNFLLGSALLASSLLPIALIAWIQRGGGSVQDKIKVAELILTLGLATLGVVAGREFTALAEKEDELIKASALSAAGQSDLAAAAKITWYRVLGLGGPFIVNAVLALAVIVGVDSDTHCAGTKAAGLGAGLSLALILVAGLAFLAHWLAAPLELGHPAQHTSPPDVVLLLLSASVILAVSPHLVLHTYHIPVFAALVSVSFAYLFIRFLLFHVADEDLLAIGVTTRIVCVAVGMACGSAIFWLFFREHVADRRSSKSVNGRSDFVADIAHCRHRDGFNC